MLRSRILSPFASKHGLVVFRAMATNLKDYESHYDIMGVTPESTKTEIREAWLRLSMLYHPDLNKENEEATNKFMEIKESYKILINDEKRKAYNDKIGFHHPDPPPEFHREWTLQGEMDRSGAQTYQVMWSEAEIRKIMCSDTLRDVNWAKQPPAERYRILREEQAKQRLARDELARTDTLSLKVGWDRYMVIILGVALLYVVVNMFDRQVKEPSVMELLDQSQDYVTQTGHIISGAARVDVMKDYRHSIFFDPAKPDNFWVTPGLSEGAAAGEFDHNAPNKLPQPKHVDK